MADKQAIHDFAEKYLDLYKNKRTTEAQLNEGFADQCQALGFSKEDGHALGHMHYREFYFDKQLRHAAAQVTDMQELGDSIYYKWNYFNNVSIVTTVDSPKARAWFTIAFARLCELSE
jgi:hypothetical protein